ncbi:FadR/GntR family transcriptional regulator [Bacillaceae bacterium IKA-2]|nr:FadR/GntR family transcriptional regulator [Bacillaceae bacterium IKA-2]
MIARKKISEQVLEEIKKRIRSGEFADNSKLPSESVLTALFGVSRVPLREALSVLSANGVIESKQGGGSWVRAVQMDKVLNKTLVETLSFDQVLYLLETRIILETEAAYLAAERHETDDLVSLYEAQKLLYENINDPASIDDKADFTFHHGIVLATKNPVLIQTVNNISDLYNQAMIVSLKLNTKIVGKKQQVYEEHQNILQAVVTRQAVDARDAMHIHLTNSLEKLKHYNESL